MEKSKKIDAIVKKDVCEDLFNSLSLKKSS
ncbi:hypothetical protein SAMN04487865_10613 [Succinivibrio dextrinosolvens]|uniref:Uncharacterized protein n=1 Tax=Succinivibrio dextrinosolvens TaxID=83771 RepID=A0A662ZDS0_9GAMM|nr:hypothetical protein SAMN04487865_10613 [Succinivibrio dextrinosolvens]